MLLVAFVALAVVLDELVVAEVVAEISTIGADVILVD